MPEQPTDLTKFADPLRIPPTLRPGPDRTVHLTSAEVQLHSELPPTPLWTYEGSFPGPTIEVRRGQRLRVDGRNRISTPYPAEVGNVPTITMPPAENQPGLDPALLNAQAAALPAWAVTHLHGAVTGGGHDDWTDNAVLAGADQLSECPNNQPATALWYHDHAMGITRLNVTAGLAGLYLVRDEEEDRLGLPAREFEVPLALCDRNLATAPDGSLTGGLLYKTVGPLPFAGRYTLVNGRIWPHFAVRPRWFRFRFRFRLLNASNARAYRLHLVDENGQRVPDALWQIGRVAADDPSPDPFTLPATLAPSYRRLTHDDLPADHHHRLLMLGRSPGIVQVRQGAGPVQTYRRLSTDFNDTLNSGYRCHLVLLGTLSMSRLSPRACPARMSLRSRPRAGTAGSAGPRRGPAGGARRRSTTQRPRGAGAGGRA